MQQNTGHAPPWPLVLRPWGRGHWLALAGVLLALLLVWLAARSADDGPLPAPATPSPTSQLTDAPADTQLAALRLALEREVAARRDLAREVAALRAEIESGSAGVAAAEAPRDSNGDEDDPAKRAVFDREVLVASGVHPRDAEELRAVWEDTEMEKIYLTDQATREGWAGTPRHRRELRALDAAVREDLSQDAYDRYLYATRKPNRALVTDVIERSPGADGGFAPGDAILSYDGQRVFGVRELRDLVSSGRPGETVRVEVMRGSSRQILDVPRGPLGLMLVPDRQAPL